MKSKAEDELIADLVDVIIDFMRINKDPEKGFTGYLKPIGLEDINGLATTLFNAIYEEDIYAREG